MSYVAPRLVRLLDLVPVPAGVGGALGPHLSGPHRLRPARGGPNRGLETSRGLRGRGPRGPRGSRGPRGPRGRGRLRARHFGSPDGAAGFGHGRHVLHHAMTQRGWPGFGVEILGRGWADDDVQLLREELDLACTKQCTQELVHIVRIAAWRPLVCSQQL